MLTKLVILNLVHIYCNYMPGWEIPNIKLPQEL